MSIENIHLWHGQRGTYFDRHVNIISWSDQYHVHLGKYNSIGRDCSFFLHANHRPDWITTSSQLWGPVTPEIASLHMEMGHPSCKGDIIVGSDVWIGAKSTIMSGIKIKDNSSLVVSRLVEVGERWWDTKVPHKPKVWRGQTHNEKLGDIGGPGSCKILV